MEELIGVLQEIRDGINNINYNIDQLKDSVEELKGNGSYNSVSDVCDKLEELQGYGSYSSVSDICDKLECLQNEVDSIKGSTGYDLTDIHSTLDSIDTNTSNL